MAAKVSAKRTDQHPIYQWLIQKTANGLMDSEMKWDFHKYRLNEQGQLVANYPSSTTPTDAIINWLIDY